MGFAGATVPAFADHFLAERDYATDARIRVGGREPANSERKRTPHAGFVEGVASGHLLSLLWRRLLLFRRRQEGQLLVARLATPAVMAHALDLVAKRLDILEAPVHGCEAHEGNLVEMTQLLHHEIADRARVDFALAHASELVADALHRLLDGLARDRPLLERLQQARAQLRFIERFAAVVALDHLRHQELGRVKGREAFLAGEAFAAAADLPTFAGEARVGDLRVRVTAKWAMHACRRGLRGSSGVDRKALAERK